MRTALCLLLALLAPVMSAGAAAAQAANAPVLLRTNDPTVSFRLWFKVGSQDDPPGKEGLAALTAAMLSEGATKNNRYDQILAKLFPLASNYGVTSSTEMSVVVGRTHRDNLADFYPLLLDAVVAPGFNQGDLDRIRARAVNSLENSLRFANDEELGKAVLYNDLFAGTTYGHIPAGTLAGLKSITLDDIRAFYAAKYTRDNVVIGLGGSFDDALVARLQQDLATLPPGALAPAPAPRPAPLQGIHVTLVEKETDSTAISLGFPIDVLRGSREWYALAIANSWLGEHRYQSGRLFQVIREVRGLNYGDYSYIEYFPGGGNLTSPPQNVSRHRQIFELWIRPVPHEARHFALRAALREFQVLVTNGMTRENFEKTRSFLRNYVLSYAPTTNERLGYALDDVFYGIDGSHLAIFRRMMSEITLEEVNAAIRKYWQFQNLEIAVVTKDAAAFATALAADAPSPITYSSPKPEAVLAEDKVIGSFPLGIKRENIRIVPVTDLFVR